MSESRPRKLLRKARRILLNLEIADTEAEFWEVSSEARKFLAEELTPYLTPTSPAPRWAIGDAVWSYNGEPRVVTGMKWAQAMRRKDEPRDHEPPWCWFIDTVHPDDPSCVGTGDEWTYSKRDAG